MFKRIVDEFEKSEINPKSLLGLPKESQEEKKEKKSKKETKKETDFVKVVEKDKVVDKKEKAKEDKKESIALARNFAEAKRRGYTA
jgi:hypothetical protein